MFVYSWCISWYTEISTEVHQPVETITDNYFTTDKNKTAILAITMERPHAHCTLTIRQNVLKKTFNWQTSLPSPLLPLLLQKSWNFKTKQQTRVTTRTVIKNLTPILSAEFWSTSKWKFHFFLILKTTAALLFGVEMHPARLCCRLLILSSIPALHCTALLCSSSMSACRNTEW